MDMLNQFLGKLHYSYFPNIEPPFSKEFDVGAYSIAEIVGCPEATIAVAAVEQSIYKVDVNFRLSQLLQFDARNHLILFQSTLLFMLESC